MALFKFTQQQMFLFFLNASFLEELYLLNVLRWNSKRRFGGTFAFIFRWRNMSNKLPRTLLASCLAYSSTQKINIIYSSPTPLSFQRMTRCRVPEGIIHRKRHGGQNIKLFTSSFSA
jgi:hypothetical protein